MLILGSQSPRRRDILDFFAIPFTQATSNFNEDSISFDKDPIHYIKQLSNGKARALVDDHPDSLILTADTIVIKDGELYEKPQNTSDSFRMLQTLNGSSHQVYTGMTLCRNDQCYFDYEITEITFHHLNDEALRKYQQQLYLLDKAGSYCVQDAGSVIIKKIEGSFYNAMGLSISVLKKLLLQFQIDLMDYLR